jgi:nucleotide-binding universal stress UspA family protein
MTDVHSFELGTDGPSAIVVGVDGSTTSLRAGAYAAGLARRQHARLVAVYVGPVSATFVPDPGTAAAVQTAHNEVFQQTADDLRHESEVAVKEHGMPVTFVATRGDSSSRSLPEEGQECLVNHLGNVFFRWFTSVE